MALVFSQGAMPVAKIEGAQSHSAAEAMTRTNPGQAQSSSLSVVPYWPSLNVTPQRERFVPNRLDLKRLSKSVYAFIAEIRRSLS